MPDVDAIIDDSALVAALEARIMSGGLGVHVPTNVVDVPYAMPQNSLHKGVTVALPRVTNLNLTRNQDVARGRGGVVVTLCWRLTANAQGDRNDAMDCGQAIRDLITDLGWLPGGVVDQIRWTGTTYGLHPASSGWYVVALSFDIDYDTDL